MDSPPHFYEIGSIVDMRQEALTEKFQAGDDCSLSCGSAGRNGGWGEEQGEQCLFEHSLGSRNRGIHESALHGGA